MLNYYFFSLFYDRLKQGKCFLLLIFIFLYTIQRYIIWGMILRESPLYEAKIILCWE